MKYQNFWISNDVFFFFFNRIRYEIVTKTTYKYSYKCVWQKIENLKKRRTRSARPVFNKLLSLQHREQQRQKAEATFTATGTKQTSVESNNAQVQRILLYLMTLVCCSFSRRLLLNFFSRFNALIKKKSTNLIELFIFADVLYKNSPQYEFGRIARKIGRRFTAGTVIKSRDTY